MAAIDPSTLQTSRGICAIAEICGKLSRANVHILHVNLVSRWFDEIAAGTRLEEYRDRTPYWETRLAEREYDVIEFRNRCAPHARRMRVESQGIPVAWKGHFHGRDDHELGVLNLQEIGQIRSQPGHQDRSAQVCPGAVIAHLDPAALQLARRKFQQEHRNRSFAPEVPWTSAPTP